MGSLWVKVTSCGSAWPLRGVLFDWNSSRKRMMETTGRQWAISYTWIVSHWQSDGVSQILMKWADWQVVVYRMTRAKDFGTKMLWPIVKTTAKVWYCESIGLRMMFQQKMNLNLEKGKQQVMWPSRLVLEGSPLYPRCLLLEARKLLCRSLFTSFMLRRKVKMMDNMAARRRLGKGGNGPQLSHKMGTMERPGTHRSLRPIGHRQDYPRWTPELVFSCGAFLGFSLFVWFTFVVAELLGFPLCSAGHTRASHWGPEGWAFNALEQCTDGE